MSSGGGPDPPLPPEKLNELRSVVEAHAASQLPADILCLLCTAKSPLHAHDAHRKAVKEQLKSLGVNDQIKNLVAEKRNYKPTKGKDPGITKEQAIEELKVLFCAFARYRKLSFCNQS